ncbi:uroporphyrinogen-III C-methyltransferase [Phyllobacterium leguminum]|uniref:Uroporphyrinogen-III C-methyltransferase n=1 Tax=Phyllobacterium leguminum TaxID=314237 RepID=A0A318T9N8_9HYPH|nr:uroporphyrinogen-III C-methyltransferase [Phyllobacterium leguminum]
MASNPASLSVFPAFFRIRNEVVVVVGDGEEALNKVRLLAETSAVVRIVSPEPAPVLARYIAEHGLEHVAEPFAPAHLGGAKLVFVATGEEGMEAAIAAEARRQRIPVNVVDRPELCDFLTPAIVNRAPVAIAIGSEGTGPVLTQMIRARIDAALIPRLGDLARLAEAYRPAVEKFLAKGVARRLFWRAFFSGTVARSVERGDEAAAHAAAKALLEHHDAPQGYVWLVGAGPGAEDLLTLRAQRVLMEADVIVHDTGVSEAIIAMGRRDAERIAVGNRKGCRARSREAGALLVQLAQEGKRVARLKSGDLFLSSRAGEEMATLRDAGIGAEIVPGISLAFTPASLSPKAETAMKRSPEVEGLNP